MVFKNVCVLVLWMKVASALEGLKRKDITFKNKCLLDFSKSTSFPYEVESSGSCKNREMEFDFLTFGNGNTVPETHSECVSKHNIIIFLHLPMARFVKP